MRHLRWNRSPRLQLKIYSPPGPGGDVFIALREGRPSINLFHDNGYTLISLDSPEASHRMKAEFTSLRSDDHKVERIAEGFSKLQGLGPVDVQLLTPLVYDKILTIKALLEAPGSKHYDRNFRRAILAHSARVSLLQAMGG